VVQRSTDDTDEIRFAWPVTGATITGQVSKGGGAFGAVAGAITFLRTEAGTHIYQIAYNAADRQEGSVRYLFTDGTYTRAVNLEVFGAVSGGGGGGTNGTGDRRIDITATRSSDDAAINGVRVSIEGTASYDTTGTLGDAQLNVDDGQTYTLIVTPPPGFANIADITVAIDGADEPVAIVLEATTLAPQADPTWCNVAVDVVTQYTDRPTGAQVSAALSTGPAVALGSIVVFDPAVTLTINGRALLKLLRGRTYRIAVTFEGQSRAVTFNVPDADNAVAPVSL